MLAYTVVVAVLNRSSSEGNADNAGNTGSEASVESQDATTNVSFLLDELKRTGHTLPLGEVSLRLNTLSATQLKDLLDRSIAMHPSTKIYSMQELLIGALARFNPRAALDKIWDFPSARWKKLIPIAFGEWTLLDLEQAIERALELPMPYKEEALRTILATQPEVLSRSSESALVNAEIHKVVQELESEDELAHMMEHPSQAWNLLVNDEMLNASQQAELVQVAEAWALKDGYGVLKNIFNDLHQLDSFLFEEILMRLAKYEPERIFMLIKDMPFEVRKNVAATMLDLWAKQHPKKALEAAGLLEHQQIRGEAQRYVIYEWARQQPRELLSSLTTVPADTQKVAIHSALRELAATAPKEAILLLRELESKTSLIEKYSYFALVEGWSRNDSTGAVSWILENSVEGSELRARMLQRALTQLVHSSPQEAMNIALSQEPHPFHGSGGLEFYVVDSVVSRGNIDEALMLLDQVRERSKSLLFGVVGRRLIESRRTNEAMDLAKRLTESEQQGYLSDLVSTWLTVNPNELLETLEALPNKSAQEEVANRILSRHQYFRNELSDEQIDFVQSFVAESTTSNTSAE